MSIPLKELQALARKIPQNERQTVKRFMEFVIERADDTLTAAEASAVDKAKKRYEGWQLGFPLGGS